MSSKCLHTYLNYPIFLRGCSLTWWYHQSFDHVNYLWKALTYQRKPASKSAPPPTADPHPDSSWALTSVHQTPPCCWNQKCLGERAWKHQLRMMGLGQDSGWWWWWWRRRRRRKRNKQRKRKRKRRRKQRIMLTIFWGILEEGIHVKLRQWDGGREVYNVMSWPEFPILDRQNPAPIFNLSQKNIPATIWNDSRW